MLTEAMRHRLRCFHAQCLRVMSHVTRLRTWQEGISTAALAREIGLDSMDNYVHRRQLRYVGHVFRMPFERLPRRMLSCWVAAPRPLGAPTMTYGRSIYRALRSFGIDCSTWPALATDRVACMAWSDPRCAARQWASNASCCRSHQTSYRRGRR